MRPQELLRENWQLGWVELTFPQARARVSNTRSWRNAGFLYGFFSLMELVAGFRLARPFSLSDIMMVKPAFRLVLPGFHSTVTVPAVYYRALTSAKLHQDD